MTFDIVAAGLRSSPALVTTASNGDHAGSLIRFHTQCGHDPIHYAVWLPTGGRTYAISRDATHIAVHVLDDSAEVVENLLTPVGDVPAEWISRCEWRSGPGGVPLLASCASHLVLRIASSGRDHGGYACLIGELVHADTRAAGAAPASAGHGIAHAELRPDTTDDRDPAGHPAGPLDVETRRLFINAAIGAGHAIDLRADGLPG